MSIIKNSEKREKALAYIRFSSQRQADEGVSLDAQKRRILDYAKFRDIPLSEEDIFIEKGVSGGIPLWDRPRGRTLKRKLASGKFPGIPKGFGFTVERNFGNSALTIDILSKILIAQAKSSQISPYANTRLPMTLHLADKMAKALARGSVPPSYSGTGFPAC